ncbi:MAG: ankyrin repeat domain-containing protein, partial [Curvibacter sp.]
MSAGDWKDLYAAASQGDLARVRYHLRAGVNPNYQHPEVLCTPLVASILHGHDAVALCLLEQGA